jgi:ABC-type glycerol-3-phosphate transport system permease component
MARNKFGLKFILGRMWISILAIFLIIACIFPLVFLIWNIPKTEIEYGLSKFNPPTNFEVITTNVKKLLNFGILRQLINTVIVCTVAVFLSAIFSSMSGYAFDKLKFPGKTIIYWVVIGLLAVPTQVFIIPLFVMFSNLNLINNLLGLAIIHTAFAYAFGTFLMKSFYSGVPNELMDSAKIDGANSLQIYLKIMLPLGKPAIIILSVLNFFSFWNELFLSMIFLQKQNMRVVTPGIASLQETAKSGRLTDWPLLFLGMLISMIIPFIIYFIFQNRLAKGITVGAIKG